jgi:hypothetical protein
MNWFKTDFIYDLECYPNIFTACFVYASGKGLRVFEISDRKNESEQILDFLRKVKVGGYRLVAFNNVNFDYPLMHYMLEKARKAFKEGKTVTYTAKELYKVGMSLISTQVDNKFGKTIKDSDVIIPQVDLFLIHHFNNRARSTSLKMLEFNMRSENIEDLPFPVGTVLNDSQKDILIKYNKHDVMETLKFYYHSYEAMKLREELSGIFGFDCTNFNDTKIGKQLFINSLEKENPGCCYTVTHRGRKINQTKRDKIVLKNCLFDYIKFERPEFKAVHDWFKQQVITETKGVFSDIEEHNLGDVAKYAKMVVKRKKFKQKPSDEDIDQFKKEHPLGWIDVEELKATEYLFDSEGNHVMEYPTDEFGNVDTSKKPKKKRVPKKSYWGCWNVAETLNVVIDGFQFDHGLGGIHGAKKGTHRSTETRKLLTYDVASYYPNMAISNRVAPKHLGDTFCDVYAKLYQMRKEQPKGSPANAALKLALNGVYGDSNNEFSPLYDPAYTMSITVGGQLSLCMLIEQLIKRCNAEIVMANTDGFEFFVDVQHLPEVDLCVKEWENITGLQMEGDNYKVMFVRDVNNYISVTESGKIKLKGAYEFAEYDKLGWAKNHSAMVIPMAVKAQLVDGVDYEEFIRFHENKFDFMLRTKVPRSSRLVLVVDNEEVPVQNICRYYPSLEGGKLVKIMPPLEGSDEERRIGIDTDWNVKVCNNINDFNWDIDYNYYFQEAKKLIDAVSNS